MLHWTDSLLHNSHLSRSQRYLYWQSNCPNLISVVVVNDKHVAYNQPQDKTR